MARDPKATNFTQGWVVVLLPTRTADIYQAVPFGDRSAALGWKQRMERLMSGRQLELVPLTPPATIAARDFPVG